MPGCCLRSRAASSLRSKSRSTARCTPAAIRARSFSCSLSTMTTPPAWQFSLISPLKCALSARLDPQPRDCHQPAGSGTTFSRSRHAPFCRMAARLENSPRVAPLIPKCANRREDEGVDRQVKLTRCRSAHTPSDRIAETALAPRAPSSRIARGRVALAVAGLEAALRDRGTLFMAAAIPSHRVRHVQPPLRGSRDWQFRDYHATS